MKGQNLLDIIDYKSSKEVEGISVPSADAILASGGHFGHSVRKWHPAYKPFLYTKRKGIYIINVNATVDSFESFISTVVNFLKNNKKILLVGTKKQASPFVEEFGRRYGLFYIAKKWPAGFFTNFEQVKLSINRLLNYKEQYIKFKYNYTKKELLDLERKIKKLESKYGGVTFMDTLPDLVIIIDTAFEKVALKESRLLKIPVAGIVDSNADPRLVDYPLLMNDDAIKTLKLFFSVLAQIFDKYGTKELIRIRNNFEEHLKALEKEVDETHGKLITMQEQGEQKIEQDNTVVVRVKAFTPIEDVNYLPDKLKSALRSAGIQSKEALERLSYEELVSIKGIGPRTARSVMKKIEHNK